MGVNDSEFSTFYILIAHRHRPCLILTLLAALRSGTWTEYVQSTATVDVKSHVESLDETCSVTSLAQINSVGGTPQSQEDGEAACEAPYNVCGRCS